MFPNPVLTSLPSLNLLTTVDHSFMPEKHASLVPSSPLPQVLHWELNFSSGTGLCEYKSWLCQLIAVWPWASQLPPLGFSPVWRRWEYQHLPLGVVVKGYIGKRVLRIELVTERHSPHGCWWGLRHATSKHGMLNILRWGGVWENGRNKVSLTFPTLPPFSWKQFIRLSGERCPPDNRTKGASLSLRQG